MNLIRWAILAAVSLVLTAAAVLCAPLLGWKLMGAVQHPDVPDRVPIVLTFNPIMPRN